jgi:alpha-tubulin suppressor-like RCC1 family protein
MAFVRDTKTYYHSDGIFWQTDFSSSPRTLNILYATGRNNFGAAGQLGDGTIINKSSPVMVLGGITNWSEVSSGYQSSFAISGGVIYSWGDNSFGNLGTNNTVSSSSPAPISGGITTWSKVSASKFSNFALGLTTGGVLYAWGVGSDGRLGTGNVIGRSSPVTVIGGITNWNTISAGNYHNLGLTDNGVLYAWGRGSGGRLGDGSSFTNRSSPVTVVGGITNWNSISADNVHSLGLTDAGVLYAWGYNISAPLGDGTTISRSSPVTVVGGITNWSAISAGNGRSLALKISV